MKIAILILSANNNICHRNGSAIMETYANLLLSKKREHEYRIYFYSGGYEKSEIIDNGSFYDIHTTSGDDINNTFEKTIDAYRMVNESYDYDVMVRCNISAYINVNLLDYLIGSINKDYIYCNAINTIITNIEYLNDMYPRGDFYIISRENVEGIVEKSGEFYGKYTSHVGLDHVDDVLVGMSYFLYKGNDYYNNIKSIIYNYLPEIVDEKFNLKSISPYAICTRVKTVPPNVNYSGYSWEDNEYRLNDVKKMTMLYNVMKNYNYTSGDINNLVIPDDKTRQTPVVYISNACIDKVKSIIKNKRAL